MKRTWTIIGVGDVPGSFKWYQALFDQPATLPAHDYFGQILDSDGTVLLCLHEWGVFSDEDAAAQLSILRAITSSDLHNLVFRADYRIVPAITAKFLADDGQAGSKPAVGRKGG
jgi:hypothetical protein